MTHTREQILAMDDEELRVAIARAKGFSEIYQRGEKLFGKINKPGRLIPAYTTDIAAAWELVEEMRNAGSAPGPFGGERWASVRIETSDWRWLDNPDIHPKCRCVFRIAGHGAWVGESDTAPLAISRAWLIWKDGAK